MSTEPNIVTGPQAETAPGVVTRYLEAANRGDIEALARCFTPEGTVVDEGHTYRGRDEIIRWRQELDSKWEYTSTVTGSRPVGDGRFIVSVLVEGNFPGGRAELTYSFSVDGELLTALTIVE
jgi:ketosteroid isomerase-like protein